jgi:uncharacterized protein
MKNQRKAETKPQPIQKKNSKKWGLWIVLLVLVGVIIYFYYDRSDTDYLPYEPPFIKHGELAFLGNEAGDTLKVISIEVADTDAKRAQGLMWRRTMPDTVGMLFVFEEENYQSFWMKNTFIPLDIMYVNSAMEIVSIHYNAIPFSEQSIPSPKPAQYVVEVIAGFARQNGINTGDRISYEIQRPMYP